MSRISLVWRVFLVLEATALVAAATYGLFLTSQIGQLLWTVQLVLLLPGSLLAGPVVERLLWPTSVGLRMIGFLEILGSVAVNAVLVWAVLFALRKSRRGSAL